MNNKKPDANWDELRTKLSSFEIPIIPFECCTIGDLIGSGAAMSVFEGIYHEVVTIVPSSLTF